MSEKTLVGQLLHCIVEQNPAHKNHIDKSRAKLPEGDAADLESYLAFCTAQGHGIEYLAECYNTIVRDTQEEQFYFLKHRRYRCSTYAEVGERVYHNPTYMSKYMYGLAITSFLWPNHNAMHHFFVDNFPEQQGGSYLEVGPGHGYYFLQAAQIGGFDTMTGVDISATSLAQTQAILGHHGYPPGERLKLHELDFLEFEPVERYTMTVMGEVLEHVEQPAAFLTKLRECTVPGGLSYLTTCVNAPAIDHIFLFDRVAVVEEMIEASGYVIEQRLHVPYPTKSVEECERRGLSINVAYYARVPV